MLQTLTLNNWKSHKHTEINFSQGYNVIVGNIGSGKTSIFDAIVFCLFGSTPNVIARKLPIKDLIMSKPVEQEEANLTLTLKINEDIYKIERILYKNKSSQAKIYKNDTLIRGPKPSDVNDEIKKLLNINLDSFMKSNYAEQNSIDYFLKLPANERKALFDNLFDISFYDDISINARQVNNKLKSKQDDLIQKVNEYKKLLENYKKEDIDNNIKSIKEEINNINTELIRTNEILNNEKQKEQEMQKQKQNYESTNILINNLLGKQAYLEKELAQLKETIKDNLSTLQNNLVKIKNEKELIQKNKLTIEQEYNNIRSKTLFYNNKLQELKQKSHDYNKINELLKDIPKEINDVVNKLVRDIDNLRDELKENETKTKTLESDIELLEKSHANCPICTQELTSNHKEEILTKKVLEKEKLIELFARTKNNYTEKQKDYDLRNKQRDYFNRNVEMFEKLKLELNDSDKYNKLLLDNTNLEKEIVPKLEKINKELENIDLNHKTLENKIRIIDDYEKKQKDLNNIKQDFNNNKELLTKLQYNPEEYTKIKEQLQKLTTEHQYKKEIIIEKDKQLKEESFKLDQYKKLFENLTFSEKESLILGKYIDDFSIISNVAKKTQEQVRQYVVESINFIFQDLWQQIYPYKDFQNIRFNVNEGDYKIELFFNNEYKRELDEFISGGERSSIALALRIAMSLVMRNKLNLIILDEPTHNLDKKTVLQLSNLFNSYLPQFVDQIFVITHDSDLEQYANNVYHIERNKETDGATEVNIK